MQLPVLLLTPGTPAALLGEWGDCCCSGGLTLDMTRMLPRSTCVVQRMTWLFMVTDWDCRVMHPQVACLLLLVHGMLA